MGRRKASRRSTFSLKKGREGWRKNHIKLSFFFFLRKCVLILWSWILRHLWPVFAVRYVFLWVCVSALNQTAIMAAVFLPAQQLSCLAQMLISFWLGAKIVRRAKQPELGCAAGLEVRGMRKENHKVFLSHIYFLKDPFSVRWAWGWVGFFRCVSVLQFCGPCGLLCYRDTSRYV